MTSSSFSNVCQVQRAAPARLLAGLGLLLVCACEPAADANTQGTLDSSVVVAPPAATPDAGTAPPVNVQPGPGPITMTPGPSTMTPVVDAGTPDAGSTTSPIAQPDASAEAGVSSPDAAVPNAAARPKPFCVAKDSQVIIIGDSYINWLSHSFPDDIKRETGQNWRMEAVGGTSIGSGGIGSIPSQFDDSIARDPDAHTVLMDGGGNDILVADATLDPWGDCTNTGSSKLANCQMIVKIALDAVDKLLNTSVTKGIRDVVYFFYPHVPANTILTGNNPNEILDYALPMVRDFCNGAEQRTGGKLRCTFVDMVPVFMGHNNWFNSDIHPNSMGSAAMAKKIWEVMKEKCIGQKGPMPCCETKT